MDEAAAKALREARRAKILGSADSRMKKASNSGSLPLVGAPSLDLSKAPAPLNLPPLPESAPVTPWLGEVSKVPAVPSSVTVEAPSVTPLVEGDSGHDLGKKAGEDIVPLPSPPTPERSPLGEKPLLAAPSSTLPSSPPPQKAAGLRSTTALAQDLPLPSSPMPERTTNLSLKRLRNVPLPSLPSLFPFLLAFSIVSYCRACSHMDWVEIPSTGGPGTGDSNGLGRWVSRDAEVWGGGAADASNSNDLNSYTGGGGFLLPLLARLFPGRASVICDAVDPWVSITSGQRWILPALVFFRFGGGLGDLFLGLFTPSAAAKLGVKGEAGSGLGRMLNGLTAALNTYKFFSDVNADVSLFLVASVAAILLV